MPDTISSRTPEGRPNRCPVCGGEICIEPSLPPGDAPCPQCGTLLWFFDSPEGCRCYEASLVESILDRFAKFVGEMLGVRPMPAGGSQAFLAEALGDDSLEAATLAMELEEEFGVTISPDEAAQIKTVADAVEFIARRKT
ncbi:MAG TPA: acyl carrier protein [Pirellulales bacterium]|nr:acyl carrier protein [Pirellulales bacterium]